MQSENGSIDLSPGLYFRGPWSTRDMRGVRVEINLPSMEVHPLLDSPQKLTYQFSTFPVIPLYSFIYKHIWN